jgi:hypothetical protein
VSPPVQDALRLPDFIIAGAPRSGTTWLYAVLDRHPDIEMAKPLTPEPKFFLIDDLYGRGLEYYSNTWFKAVPLDKLTGEKSTNYLESSEAARRIRRCIPAVKLIFVLRNPIERAFSNYLWSRQNGLEKDDFEAALAREKDRDRDLPQMLRYARPHSLFARGLYADLLSPYLECFAREQILVLRYEDILTSPGGVAESLQRFLGVTLRRQDGEDQEPLNRAKDAESAKMDPETRQRLSSRYAAPNKKLYDLLGPDFRAWHD